MGLLSNRTHWFFILPSSTEAEERHIHDIAFGVKILLYKGIDYNDISVIIDHAPCYAGIFNQMPLSTHLGLSKNPKCQMVAVGGTGLFSSVSAPLTVNSITWSANIFLMYIFNWLLTDKDIDGDGKLSVMDSFKFASIYTNEALKDIKKKNNLQSIIEQSNLMSCIDKLHSEDIPQEEKDNIQLEILALEKMLEIRYVMQEPWILNASIAMSTVF